MFKKKNQQIEIIFQSGKMAAGAAVTGKMLLTCFPRLCYQHQQLLRFHQVHRLFIDAEILTDRIRLSDAERAPVCFSSINYEKKKHFQSDSSGFTWLVDKFPVVLLQLQSFPLSSGPARPLRHRMAEVPNSLMNERSSGTRRLQAPRRVVLLSVFVFRTARTFFSPILMGEKNKFNIWCVSRRQWSGPGWTVNELLH